MPLRSSQTIQLSNTQPTGSSYTADDQWRIDYRNAAITPSNLQGWSVSLVSGNWGNTNAVISITAPATLAGNTEWYERATFRHGDIVTRDTLGKDVSELRQYFVIAFSTASNPNPARYAMAFQGRSAYLAKTTNQGTQIYAGTVDAVPVEARGLIPDYYINIDNLWTDSTGRLWAFVTGVDSFGSNVTISDQAIFVSSDSGRTWITIGTLPAVPRFGWMGRGPTNELLATLDNIWVSYDDGATWAQRAATVPPVWVRPQTGQLMSNVVQFSNDTGRTWFGGTTLSSLNRTHPAQNGLILRILLSAGNLLFRKSYDNGATWTAPVTVAAVSHGSWTIHEAADGLMYLFDSTTRRVSFDGGRTWA